MKKPTKAVKQMVIGFLLIKSQYTVLAQNKIDSTKTSGWTNHYQLTIISESHAGFKAAYHGMNSLADSTEVGAMTVTSTLFLGRRLWKGAAFYFNPELSGGRGLSSAVGVAGALNGESYRVGNPEPAVFIARAYLQQNIALGNASYEKVNDDVNQIAGTTPTSRIWCCCRINKTNLGYAYLKRGRSSHS
jgi:high affinity Mn2+ porin